MATELKGRQFSINERTQVVTFQQRWYADTEDEALFELPTAYRGLSRKGKSGAEWDAGAGKWIADLVFEGLLDDPDEEYDTFELTGELREEPLETFPVRSLLVEDYGGRIEGERLVFPEDLPSSASPGAGFAGRFGAGFAGAAGFASRQSSRGGLGGQDDDRKNPFHNVHTYPVEYELAVHSYVRRQVPAAVDQRKGTIVTTLPAGFEYQGTAKAWYVRPPVKRRQGHGAGKFWSIQETYQAVDAIKHIEVLAILAKKGAE